MFGIGHFEILIIGFVALMIFGKRLPETMRSLGAGIKEFKASIRE